MEMKMEENEALFHSYLGWQELKSPTFNKSGRPFTHEMLAHMEIVATLELGWRR